MRVRHLTAKAMLATSLLGAGLLLTACGDPGSGGGEAAPTAADTSAGSTSCDPVAGDKLVVLTDDKGLQNSDNIIPAINKAAADKNPQIVDLLNSVSSKLDTDKLIQLNKAVDIDRKTSSEAAAEFVKAEGLDAQDQSGKGTKLVVGAANFSENATLAEIYAAVLKAAGFDATTRTVGNRETYLPVLEKGDLVAVPEYAATLADFLNAKINGSDAASVASPDIDTTVAALKPLAEASKLVMGEASAAQDQNAFAVTQEFADAHSVKSLSDLATACGSGLTLAGPPECAQRPFCQPGLEKTYGLKFDDFKSYDFGLIGAAIRKGEVSMGLVLSSDGSLAS